MTERQVPQTTIREQRERTITLLCEHFAADRLELEDFEARLDRAHRAASPADLDALLADLPAPTAAPRPATPARDALARGGRAVSEAIRDSRTFLAFMGGVERRGAWVPARKNIVVAVMGGVELDFRDVDLPAGVTEVHLVCFMGGASIIVPHGLAVDSGGTIAIMGGVEHGTAFRQSDPDSPVLRINGVCIMGGLEITVRQPGESARDARRREKEERRLQREQQKRLRGE